MLPVHTVIFHISRNWRPLLCGTITSQLPCCALDLHTNISADSFAGQRPQFRCTSRVLCTDVLSVQLNMICGLLERYRHENINISLIFTSIWSHRSLSDHGIDVAIKWFYIFYIIIRVGKEFVPHRVIIVLLFSTAGKRSECKLYIPTYTLDIISDCITFRVHITKPFVVSLFAVCIFSLR